MIFGVDEAGRGSVLGPLIVCAVGVKKNDLKFLKKIGVRDSKLLSDGKRTVLSAKILNLAIYKLLEISPKQIDDLRKNISLNKITLSKFAEALIALNVSETDEIYVDSCDVKAERFGEDLKKLISHKKIVSEHKADSKYLVVSAASILAKVRRDEKIEELKKKVGIDFGSGYPSDERTIRFLREWYLSHKNFPDFARKSWKTLEKLKQKNLDSFL